MEKIVLFQCLAMILTCIIISCSSNEVKVINSTEIKNVKLPHPPKEKSGSVFYVYPEKNVTIPDFEDSLSNKNKTNCTVTVKENGFYKIYNQTREEAEKLGKVVYDELCEEGIDEEEEEEEGDIPLVTKQLNQGTIASLAGK